ncbi:hypothetical protein PENTCL1PPCAC_7139, partial [Pristionchus entomophagus]
RSSFPLILTHKVAAVFVPSQIGHAPCSDCCNLPLSASMLSQTIASPFVGRTEVAIRGNTVPPPLSAVFMMNRKVI